VVAASEEHSNAFQLVNEEMNVSFAGADILTIVSLDPIWLMFNVSEGDGMTYKRLVQKGEIESARSNSDITLQT